MIAQRRDDEVAAEAKAREARRVVLPAAAWEEIRARSAVLGIAVEQIDDGSGVQVTADLGQPAGAAAAP